MTVLSINIARVKPGRLPDLIAGAADLVPVIQQHSGGRTRLVRIAVGGEQTGIVYGEVEFDDLATRGRYLERVADDPVFQTLVRAIFGPDGPAIPIGSLVGKVVAEFGTIREGYVGAHELIRTWEVKRGRLDEFIEIAERATPFAEVHGGRVRLLQTVIGGAETGGYASAAEFPTLAALGAYIDSISSDADLQSIWGKVLGPDTPAVALNTSIHSEVVV